MNEAIFASMRDQMGPSDSAQAALWARLAAEPIPQKKEVKRMKQWKPLALAACAARVLCAYAAYNALKPQPSRLHSFTVVSGSDPVGIKAEYQETIAQGVDKGGEEEEGPNTGDLPGGAYIGEVPVQLGADAYQLLMENFGGVLPDWYGGAYVTDTGSLMVLLVEDQDPGDKTLELEELEAVGDLPVGYTSAKYSRNELERMNGELLTLLDGKGLPATWGIYDDQNRIILDVPEPLPDDILTAIAKIDPDDDAILIRVVQDSAVVTPDLMKGPDPAGDSVDPVPGGVTVPGEDTVDPEEGEDPALFIAYSDNTAPEDEDLIAIEPQIKDLPVELPETKGVKYDLLPSVGE